MKMLWSRRASHPKITPHPATRTLDGIAIDFLRMIGAAVLSGFAISIVAATLAMLLARTADASPAPMDVPSPSLLEGPGVLAAGMGCDSVPIEANERDWWVKIDGKRAVVRVMQSFLLPEDSEGTAVFTAFLPRKAALLSLTMQTTRADYEARILRREETDAMDADAYKDLTRRDLIVTVDVQGEITTSLLPGLDEGRVVTVTYSYAVPIVHSAGKAHFALPLTETRFAALDSSMASASSQGAESLRGAVWVEWIGSAPRRVDGAPAESTIERANGRIEALSWESKGLVSGARLQLSWSS